MIKYITQQVINLLGYLFYHYDTLSSLSTSTVTLSTSNSTTDSIAFGVSGTSYGYIIPGADTVVPFKSQRDIDAAYTSGYNAGLAAILNKTWTSGSQGITCRDSDGVYFYPRCDSMKATLSNNGATLIVTATTNLLGAQNWSGSFSLSG